MANEDLTQDPNYTTPGGVVLPLGARNPHQQTDLVHGGNATNYSAISSLSTSTSTGFSTVDSAVASLSTVTGSSIASLSTLTSTGFSTVDSSIASLSTSTSTAISTTNIAVASLSTSLRPQRSETYIGGYFGAWAFNSGNGSISNDSEFARVTVSAASSNATIRNTTTASIQSAKSFTIGENQLFEIEVFVADAASKLNINNCSLYLSTTSGFTTNTFCEFRFIGGALDYGLNKLRFTLEDAIPSGTFDVSTLKTAAVVNWQFRVNTNSGGGASVTFKNFGSIKKTRGRIIFCSDDGIDNQYTQFFNTLQDYGLTGCVGVVSSLVGTPNYVTLAQLYEMRAHGFDLCNHTANHVKLTTLANYTAKYDEIILCRDYLRTNGLTGAENILIYPNGGVDADVEAIVSRYMWLGRTVAEGIMSQPYVDPAKLKVINLIPTNLSGITGLSVIAAKAMIDNVEKYGGTLVFLGHRYVSSAPTVTTEYLASDFAQIVGYVANSEKNLDVTTFSQLYKDEYKVSHDVNTPRISVTHWTFTPTAPITVNNNTQYNLFSDAQFVEGSAQVVKVMSGDAELFIAVNEAVKSAKFARVNGDEDVSIRCQIEFSFGGGQTGTVEIALMRPTLTTKVAPFLIARTDNNYPINSSVHQTFAISEADNFYVHGVYPQIDNQSGSTMKITKISVLIKRVFEGDKV